MQTKIAMLKSFLACESYWSILEYAAGKKGSRMEFSMAKLVECIPNFSVSKEKDPVTFQALVDTANSVPGCVLFDVQSDGNHNRCVFTLLGSPEAIEVFYSKGIF